MRVSDGRIGAVKFRDFLFLVLFFAAGLSLGKSQCIRRIQEDRTGAKADVMVKAEGFMRHS